MTTRIESTAGNDAGGEAASGRVRRTVNRLKAIPQAVLPWIKRSLTRVTTYVILLLGLLATQHLRSKAITLSLVSLPPSLSQTELSAQELTQRLADKLDSLAQAARTSDGGGVFALQSDVELPPIEVPGIGMTLPQLMELATGALGISHRRTVWEISARPQPSVGAAGAQPVSQKQWLLTAHLSGKRSHQVAFNPADPEPALSAIALDILGDVDPLILVRALLFSQDCDGARARANAYLRQVSSAQAMARMYNTLGLAAECPSRDTEAGNDDRPDWGEAERYYQAAIRFDSEAVMPSVNLARMRVQRDSLQPGITAGVLMAFDSAAKRDPTLADVQDAWGWSLLVLGEWTKAIEHANLAIALDPTTPAPYKILAKASNMLGKPQDAIRAFSLALARDPNDATTLTEYGHTLLDMGDAVGASRAFARAYRVDPASVHAQFYLAESLRTAGRSSAVGVYCRVMQRSTPGDLYYDAASSAIADMMNLGVAGCPAQPSASGRRRRHDSPLAAVVR
jgi:tetratricopeptide (TPR) repeat protein